MIAIVIPIGGAGTRVSSITRGRTKAEINIVDNKKIIDLQLKKISKLKKKLFFLSNSKYETLNSYLLKI